MPSSARRRRLFASAAAAGLAVLLLGCSTDPEPRLPPPRLGERNAALKEVEARLAELDGADAGVAAALVRHADHRVRRAAALRLMLLGDAAAGSIPALVTLLDDEQPRVRTAAARALGAIGGTSQVGPLLDHLADPDRQVRVWVWKSLRRLGDDALPAVADALSNKSPHAARSYRDEIGKPHTVRDELMDRFATIGAPAVPLLRERLASADLSLADGALHVLGRIGSGAQSALPEIIATADAAKDPELAVRALDTIERIGDRHPDVIPAVKRAVGSKDKRIAAQARKTLAALEKAAAGIQKEKGKKGSLQVKPKGKTAAGDKPAQTPAAPPEEPFDPNLD